MKFLLGSYPIHRYQLVTSVGLGAMRYDRSMLLGRGRKCRGESREFGRSRGGASGSLNASVWLLSRCPGPYICNGSGHAMGLVIVGKGRELLLAMYRSDVAFHVEQCCLIMLFRVFPCVRGARFHQSFGSSVGCKVSAMIPGLCSGVVQVKSQCSVWECTFPSFLTFI